MIAKVDNSWTTCSNGFHMAQHFQDFSMLSTVLKHLLNQKLINQKLKLFKVRGEEYMLGTSHLVMRVPLQKSSS